MSTPEEYFNALTNPKIGQVPVFEYAPLITLRVEHEQLETLQRAANTSGESLERFMIKAAMHKANEARS
jgi:predicted HicB family RNase H-like nuclease